FRAFPLTTSAPPVSFGATRSTTGNCSRRLITNGGLTGSVPQCASMTSCALTISADLKRTGKFLATRAQQQTGNGSKGLAPSCFLLFSLNWESYPSSLRTLVSLPQRSKPSALSSTFPAWQFCNSHSETIRRGRASVRTTMNVISSPTPEPMTTTQRQGGGRAKVPGIAFAPP